MAYIAPLPDPPQRSDPDNFAARADTFLAALPVFGSEIDAIYPDIATCASNISSVINATPAAATATAKAAAAAASASAAAASATAAATAETGAELARDAAAAIVYTQPVVMAPHTITASLQIPTGLVAAIFGDVTIAPSVTIEGLGDSQLVGLT